MSSGSLGLVFSPVPDEKILVLALWAQMRPADRQASHGLGKYNKLIKHMPSLYLIPNP